jgi:adenine deaminase
MSFRIKGKIVDVFGRRIFPGEVFVENGKIASVIEKDVMEGSYILPGFVDAHVHIESSMLIPSQFAKAAVKHGTVAVVSDPHEIANVCGVEGVVFMIENGKKVPFLFHFGAPSCVPATSFESSGSILDDKAVESLLQRKDIFFLAEMMNFPGVVNGDPQVLNKIAAAKKAGKKIDGHAPGLSGENLSTYISRGISTDHECMTLGEALEKIHGGMKILIREGSAARNMFELLPVLKTHPDMVMFCTDDSHPDTLLQKHINYIVREALKNEYDIFDVLRSASVNAVQHYGLNVGLLRVGDKADFIVVNDLKSLAIQKTIINGQIVFEHGQSQIPEVDPGQLPNQFLAEKITKEDVLVPAGGTKMRVIEMIDGELYTKSLIVDIGADEKIVYSKPDDDILKLVVLNRYSPQKPQVGFVKGFGLKNGALASSIAHDSHNIVAVGATDGDLVAAINAVIDTKGGLSVSLDGKIFSLPLPVAGLMSVETAEVVAANYSRLESHAHEMGASLQAPFMALSFLSLLVIPELKLSDKGLFDVNKFEFTSLFV